MIFSIAGKKGILKKHKQDPEKKGLEKKQEGKNKDITPGWSLPDTHGSLPDTHVSPPDTHVSPPATPPRAKSQKTRGKLLIFHEIDFPITVFNENLFILHKKTFWKRKKQKYTFPINKQSK